MALYGGYNATITLPDRKVLDARCWELSETTNGMFGGLAGARSFKMKATLPGFAPDLKPGMIVDVCCTGGVVQGHALVESVNHYADSSQHTEVSLLSTGEYEFDEGPHIKAKYEPPPIHAVHDWSKFLKPEPVWTTSADLPKQEPQPEEPPPRVFPPGRRKINLED